MKCRFIKYVRAFRLCASFDNEYVVQARRVDSVEGGSFIFWEVFFSARCANTSAEGATL